MNQSILKLLDIDGPVAITLQEPLASVLGNDSPVFPPTFAPAEGEEDGKPSYVIDEVAGQKVALMDSAGSQANRLEPIFKKPPYSELIPSVTVTIGNREIDLLDAGHRAADAVVRFSDAWAQFQKAFEAYRDGGEATQLAKLAPTSLVFGVWDSRETQVKLPRLVESTVRATGVEQLTRSAQYFTTLTTEELTDLNLDQKSLSKQGLDDAPAGRLPGGVIAKGGIRRQALLNLIALRALKGESKEATGKLQAYVLGLSLVALTAPCDFYLRQGCVLVADGAAKCEVVYRDGKREDFSVNSEDALTFAKEAAAAFGVGESFKTTFRGENVTKSEEAKKQKKPKAK